MCACRREGGYDKRRHETRNYLMFRFFVFWSKLTNREIRKKYICWVPTWAIESDLEFMPPIGKLERDTHVVKS